MAEESNNLILLSKILMVILITITLTSSSIILFHDNTIREKFVLNEIEFLLDKIDKNSITELKFSLINDENYDFVLESEFEEKLKKINEDIEFKIVEDGKVINIIIKNQ